MDQLLVALDVARRAHALDLVEQLTGVAGGFKVGSQLFLAEGPSVVRTLVDRGERVFLDLKFHDIPHTVAQTVSMATRLGVWMLTLHASGGVGMMRAAVAAAHETATRIGTQPPMVVGVTVLTSLDGEMLQQIGVNRSVDAQVKALAVLARQTGLDGVVSSPQEASILRAACGPEFTIVTPGIRLSPDGVGHGAAASPADDQVRTYGPADAIRAGATYVVVGRPIIAADNPAEAAAIIGRELAQGSVQRIADT